MIESCLFLHRSELYCHIVFFSFVNGLNIEEVLSGSINSDCKCCLPNVFRFGQNLLIHGPNLFSPNKNYNGVDIH